MAKQWVKCVGGASVMLLAGAITTIGPEAKAASSDPIPCAAWADTVVGNTGSVTVNAATLIDSYQSSAGAYGGTNVGSAAVVQAGTTIVNNGGVIHGTQKQHAPAGFSVIAVPSGAKNLPLGSSAPGSLNVNTVA